MLATAAGVGHVTQGPRGIRITECDASAVRGVFRHFAGFGGGGRGGVQTTGKRTSGKAPMGVQPRSLEEGVPLVGPLGPRVQVLVRGTAQPRYDPWHEVRRA